MSEVPGFDTIKYTSKTDAIEAAKRIPGKQILVENQDGTFSLRDQSHAKQQGANVLTPTGLHFQTAVRGLKLEIKDGQVQVHDGQQVHAFEAPVNLNAMGKAAAKRAIQDIKELAEDAREIAQYLAPLPAGTLKDLLLEEITRYQDNLGTISGAQAVALFGNLMTKLCEAQKAGLTTKLEPKATEALKRFGEKFAEHAGQVAGVLGLPAAAESFFKDCGDLVEGICRNRPRDMVVAVVKMTASGYLAIAAVGGTLAAMRGLASAVGLLAKPIATEMVPVWGEALLKKGFSQEAISAIAGKVDDLAKQFPGTANLLEGVLSWGAEKGFSEGTLEVLGKLAKPGMAAAEVMLVFEAFYGMTRFVCEKEWMIDGSTLDAGWQQTFSLAFGAPESPNTIGKEFYAAVGWMVDRSEDVSQGTREIFSTAYDYWATSQVVTDTRDFYVGLWDRTFPDQ